MYTDPYDPLTESLRNWLFGLPDSEHLRPLLAQRVSPEEAGLLAAVPHLPHTLDQLQPRLNLPLNDLAAKLEDWSSRGLVMKTIGKNEPRYQLGDSLLWFYRMPGYEGRDDGFNRALAPFLNRYSEDVYSKAMIDHRTGSLRAVPIHRTIQDTRMIKPYEDILEVVNRARRISVSQCACRHRRNLDPDLPNCVHPTETCLHFDRLADYLLQYDIGRELSKAETRELLAMTEDEGLIHAVSNTKTGMETVCNCCSCCCLFIQTRSGDSRPVSGHQPSSFVPVIDRDACRQCGLCVVRCPVKAISLEKTGPGKMRPDFDAEQCLGCGLCAHTCAGQALMLVPRGVEPDLPNDPVDFAQRVLMEQGLDPGEVFKRNP